MSEIDSLVEKAKTLGGDELASFLAGLSTEQREQVDQRLASTLIPDTGRLAETIAPEASVDQDGTIESDSDEPGAKSRFIPPRHPQRDGDIPKSIGPFKILQPIGEGGMGQVFMAEQQEPVKRRVALKIINTETPSERILARFEAERQALAMMDHQNIAKVLDAGMTDDGRPYFAMELVKGIPITEYCDQNRLTPSARLELFVQTCRAIQHAHQKGIIHRDLKPSNILVTLYDGKPTAKVIDFGLAKAVHDQMQLTNKTLFTQYGQVVGTLEYMSPEQAELNSLDVDTRTDVYSLGVILYELLTGSTPIGRERLRSEAFDRILALIREEEAPRPSIRLSESGDAVTGISQQRNTAQKKLSLILRGDLDWIAVKSLEKDRTRRYDGVAAMADDIERFLDDKPIEARPPTVGYRLHKAFKKHRAGFLTAASLLGLLVAGLLGTGAMWWRATAEANRATIAEGLAVAEANKATLAAAKTREAKAEVEKERDGAQRQKEIAENRVVLVEALSDQWRLRLTQQALAASDYRSAQEQTQIGKTEFPDRYLAGAAARSKMQASGAYRDGHWEFLSASVNAAGDRLVAADAGGLISVWAVPEGRVLGRLTRGMWSEKDVIKEGKLVFPGQQWIHYSWQDRDDFEVTESELYSSVCWTEDPERVVATTMSGRCIVLDPAKYVDAETIVESELLQTDAALTAVSASEDGSMVAIGSDNGDVYVGTADGSTEFSSVHLSDGVISCIRPLGADRWVVGNTDGSLAIIDQGPQVIQSLTLADSIWDVSVKKDERDWTLLVTTDAPRLTSLRYRDSEGIHIGPNFVCAANTSVAYNGAQFIDSRNEIWAVDSNGDLYVWTPDGHGSQVANVFSRSRLPWRDLPTSTIHRSIAGIIDMDDAGVLTLGGGGTVRAWRREHANPGKVASKLLTTVGPDPRATFTQLNQKELWVIDSQGILSLIDIDGDQISDQVEAHHPDQSSAMRVDITAMQDGRVATVAHDSKVRIWKSIRGKIRPDSELQSSRPLISVAVSLPARRVAAVDENSRLHVWDLDEPGPAEEFEIPGSIEEMPLTGRLGFNRDGKHLAVFGSGQASAVFDTQSWKPLFLNLHTAGRGGLDVAWSNTENDLVVRADTQPTVVPIQVGRRLTDLGSPITQDRVGNANIVDLDALPQREGFVSISETGVVAFRSSIHYVKTFELETGVQECTSVAVNANNTRLVITTMDGSLRVVSAANPDHMTNTDFMQPIEPEIHRLLSSKDGYNWLQTHRLVRQGDGSYAALITCGTGSRNDSGELLLATQNDEGWTVESIYADPSQPVDKHGAALIDAGGPVVAFRRRTLGTYSGDLLLARRGPQGWDFENIYSRHNAGHHPVICTTDSGEIHSVLHYDHAYRGLMASVKGNANEKGWPTNRILPTWGVYMKGLNHDGVTYIAYSSHRHNNDGGLGGKASWDGKTLTRFESTRFGSDNVLSGGRFCNVINTDGEREIEVWEAGRSSIIAKVPAEFQNCHHVLIDPDNTIHLIGWDEKNQQVQMARQFEGDWTFFKSPIRESYSRIRDATVMQPGRMLLLLEGSQTLSAVEVEFGR